MLKINCPSCGFVAHFVSSDGVHSVYKCERCGYIFKIFI